MVRLTHTRASALLGIEDDYTAWCLDEAISLILAGFERKRTLRPRKESDDNSALLARYFGGNTP